MFEQRTTLKLLPAVLLFINCADSGTPTSPSLQASDVSAVTVSSMALSCYDESDPQCSNTPPPGDPSPTSPGYYLGPDFSWDACTDGTQTDVDLDGVSDFCEFQLALVFRPLLSTSPTDGSLSRETYWAVAQTGGWMTVVYMIGYHNDPGVPNCGWSPPVGCTPHLGDNEFIVTNLTFDAATEHWRIATQFFSAHWGCIIGPVLCDYSQEVWWGGLEYPTGATTYSRVYVAHRKHANYATRSACNSGAFGTDTCAANTDLERLTVSRYRNVGSNFGRTIDASYSANPGTYPGVDYFWTSSRFCGWQVTSGSREGCSPTGYSNVLNWFLGW